MAALAAGQLSTAALLFLFSVSHFGFLPSVDLFSGVFPSRSEGGHGYSLLFQVRTRAKRHARSRQSPCFACNATLRACRAVRCSLSPPRRSHGCLSIIVILPPSTLSNACSKKDRKRRWNPTKVGRSSPSDLSCQPPSLCVIFQKKKK